MNHQRIQNLLSKGLGQLDLKRGGPFQGSVTAKQDSHRTNNVGRRVRSAGYAGTGYQDGEAHSWPCGMADRSNPTIGLKEKGSIRRDRNAPLR